MKDISTIKKELATIKEEFNKFRISNGSVSRSDVPRGTLKK